jgi:FMN phosphatase YigB (HAD superfamily)
VNLQAALVDVGGTLWPERSWASPETLTAKRAARLRAAGLDSGAIDALLPELWERTRSGDELEYLDVWAMVDDACAAAMVQGVSPDAVRHAMYLPAAGSLEPLPGARQLLECVRDLGLRCVIASNGVYRAEAEYRDDFQAQGLAHLIHSVVSSVDTRWRKPNTRFFEAALGAAGAPARACVMIGNSEAKDIVPAAALGMRTLRVAIEEPTPAASVADTVCESLEEAATALRQLVQQT